MSNLINEWEDDFLGAALDDRMWVAATTQTGGSPSAAIVDGAIEAGECALTLDSTSEAQSARIANNDKLWLPSARLRLIEFWVKINAAFAAEVELAFGLTGDYNATHDSIAQMMVFRKIGTANILVETDDGTTDNDDKDTGFNFVAGNYHKFSIDIGSKGLNDVQFGVDSGGKHQRVLKNTTFDVSKYTGAYQLHAKISKSSGTGNNVATIDKIRVKYAK